MIFHTKYPKHDRAPLRNWKKYDLRTTELDIVELDTSGNYRDRTSHNKKNCIWYTDTLMKNLLNFENEFIEYRKS
jgi:hypothetical protein